MSMGACCSAADCSVSDSACRARQKVAAEFVIESGGGLFEQELAEALTSRQQAPAVYHAVTKNHTNELRLLEEMRANLEQAQQRG